MGLYRILHGGVYMVIHMYRSAWLPPVVDPLALRQDFPAFPGDLLVSLAVDEIDVKAGHRVKGRGYRVSGSEYRV